MYSKTFFKLPKWQNCGPKCSTWVAFGNFLTKIMPRMSFEAPKNAIWAQFTIYFLPFYLLSYFSSWKKLNLVPRVIKSIEHWFPGKKVSIENHFVWTMRISDRHLEMFFRWLQKTWSRLQQKRSEKLFLSLWSLICPNMVFNVASELVQSSRLKKGSDLSTGSTDLRTYYIICAHWTSVWQSCPAIQRRIISLALLSLPSVPNSCKVWVSYRLHWRRDIRVLLRIFQGLSSKNALSV